MTDGYTISSQFWQVVDHWQTLITGAAALLAALATIKVTRDAARREIEAANRQIAVAERQILAASVESEYDHQIEKRRILNDIVVACRMLDAVVGNVEEQAARLAPEIPSAELSNLNLSPAQVAELFSKVQKPDLVVVWDTLKLVDPSTVAKYLRVDFLLSNWQQPLGARRDGREVQGILRRIATEAKIIRAELYQTAKEMDEKIDRSLEALGVLPGKPDNEKGKA